MARTKPKSYGKPVKKHKGYTIRLLLKVAGKNEPSGKYAIFAGKNKIEGEHPSVDASVQAVETLIKNKVSAVA